MLDTFKALSINAAVSIPVPAPGSNKLIVSLKLEKSNILAINSAVSFDVKNCPFFFRSDLGIFSRKLFVEFMT